MDRGGVPAPLLELFAPGLSDTAPRHVRGTGGDLRSLHHTLEWVREVLEAPREASAWSAELAPAWRAAQSMVRDAIPLARDLLRVFEEELLANAEKSLFGILQRWAKHIGSLQTGECALLPLAWPEPGVHGGQLHAALAVVHKVTLDTGTVAIVNALGSGNEYHPQQLRGPPTRPTLCTLPVMVGPVRWSRLSNLAFWLYVLRPLVRHAPCSDPHPALLYEALLPFLNRRGRRSQLASQLSAEGCDEEWRAVPISNESLVHTVFQALSLALGWRERSAGRARYLATWAMKLLQWEALKRYIDDGVQSGGLPLPFVREACRSLARNAAGDCKLDPGRGSEASFTWQTKMLDSLLSWLRRKFVEVDEQWAHAKQVLPEAPQEWNTDITSCVFGGFHRIAENTDSAPLAGEPELPDVVLPVPLVQVPGSVRNYHEAAIAVERCVRACSMFVNQRGLISHADFHVVALVQNLFSSVLPVPTPRSRGADGCFWRKDAMERETQMSLLCQMNQVIRYFLASSLCLPRTSHLHGVRLLTLAAAVAVIDAIVRRVQINGNTEFARVYSGHMRPDLMCGAFELAPTTFAGELKAVALTDQRSMQVRTRVLDYFASEPAGEASPTSEANRRKPSRRVFGFADMQLSPNDLEMLHRLALLGGFARGSQADKVKLSRFFTGQVPEFLSRFPGVGFLRDAVFLLRLLCLPLELSPPDRCRPDRTPWQAGDFKLKWEYNAEEDTFRVYGLQRRLLLDPAEFLPRDTSASFVKRMTTAFFGGSEAGRRAASPASPTALAGGRPIETEDDALHEAEMPTFDGLLAPSDSEQLLAYLTVPYLRVPLVLQFFNDRTRLSALACPQLQAMLDAILFEPGPFADPHAPPLPCPTEIAPLGQGPAAEAALATPAGRFVHELVHSGGMAQGELDGIFRLAMERDMPSYTPAAAAVLYVVRLWARTVAYAYAIVRNSTELTEPTRGFGSLPLDTARSLNARAHNWRTRLHLEAVPTLERWCKRAMETGSTDVACSMWLHLALLFRHEEELTMQGVSTLLCAEVYVNSNLLIPQGVSESRAKAHEETLGFSYSEVFELFHATRPRVYSWLKQQEQSGLASRVLEHVVSVVASSRTASQLSEEAATLGRRWRELEKTWEGAGRFAPSAPRAADIALAEEDFSQWLIASVDSAPVEVNVNIGQLQFRQHTVTPVPREVLALPEFREVFPGIDVDATGLMWALVEKAPRRQRYRFAGLRYEFRLWTTEGSDVPQCHWTRDLKHQATADEGWIQAAVCSVPELRDMWSSGRWLAPEEPQTGDFARLIVYPAEKAGQESYDWEGMYLDPYAMHGGTNQQASESGALDAQGVREVEIFRRPAAPGRPLAAVHVYETVKCGPWSARTQVSTSDSAWSYACQSLGGAWVRSAEGVSPPKRSGQRISTAGNMSWGSGSDGDQLPGRVPSLEITHEDSSGESVLVPQRFLAGALPDCLLEIFEFWRAQPKRLVGKMQPAARRLASVPAALVVQFTDEGAAYVLRIALDAAGRVEEAKQVDVLMHMETRGSSVRGHMLVDLLRAPHASRAWAVARWALLLDDLSNVLAWTLGEVVGGHLHSHGSPYIEAVEFPRLGLTFSVSPSDRRLRCDQHGGLHVVEGRVHEASLLRILRPFPRCVLLQDDGEELFALVSIADRPERSGAGVSLRRGDEDWLANLRVDQRHQLFAVHASHQFLTATTQLAQLHLMLLRILQGMYVEACGDVPACLATGLPKEAEERFLWLEVTEALHVDRSVDAAVVRLKLMLQLHWQGLGPPEGWDLESDLVAWTKHGSHCACGRMLTPAEDAALLGLCSTTSVWELRVRHEALSKLLGLGAANGHCTQRSPGAVGTPVVVARSERDLADAGPKERGRALLDEFQADWPIKIDDAVMQHFRRDRMPLPEDAGAHKSGVFAMSWFLQRLPLHLTRDFILLYELVTGIKKIWLSPSDDPALTGELLVCLIPPSSLAGCPPLAGLIKAIEFYPAVTTGLPNYQGDPEDFMERMATAVDELGETLRAPTTEGFEGTTAASKWIFKLGEGGVWETLPAAEPAPEEPLTVQAEAEDGGPLTNPRLLSLLAGLTCFGDRRMPSVAWDFDCRSRGLPAIGSREEAGMKDRFAELSRRMPGLPFDQLPILTSRPLADVGSQVTWGPSHSSVSARSAFALDSAVLERCSSMRTTVGRKLLRRMQSDSANATACAEEPRLIDFKGKTILDALAVQADFDRLLKEVSRLRERLTALLKEDRVSMLRAVQTIVDLSQGSAHERADNEESNPAEWMSRLVQQLRHIGGNEVAPTFQDALQMLLVSGGMERVLPHINPLVQGRPSEDISAACVLAMLLSSRVVIGRRCLVSLTRLSKLLEEAVADKVCFVTSQKPKPVSGVQKWLFDYLPKGDEDPIKRANVGRQAQKDAAANERAWAIAEAAEQAARELVTEQHCVKDAAYDPRFLCFEFVSRIALRGKQVKMVRDMVEAVEIGKPLVHQMLMGEGKTTVVTPLVVLLSATAERACVVCCPAAILEFTCRVLRERLRGALARPVVLFDFARATEVSDDLYLRLLLAQDARGALCSGPTAMKSLMLRFLLTIHDIDLTRNRESERNESERHSRKSFVQSLMSWSTSTSTAAAAKALLHKLSYEAEVLSSAFRVFRGAVLLLDDIDLLMHPLRSELHWPLGDTHKLDFTAALGAQSVVTNDASRDPSAALMSYVAGSPIGARWQAAFHLLDGFFSCQLSNGPAVTSLKGQGTAPGVLKKLRKVVQRGLQEKQLQASPHLALLSTTFYHEELRPILAEWMLLWLRRRHPIPVQDTHLLAYLCGSKVDERVIKGLGDHQFKALNLARTWLAVLMPHLASRIHRVHYGLLSESATGWTKEPRARRFFAVPFVGKDAPSDSSQFSHPDVVIGLTWLAFRLGGLRPGDFERAVVCLLKLERSEVDVPPRLRQAHRFYNAWVAEAKGYVRGEIEEDLQEEQAGERNFLVLQSSGSAAAKSSTSPIRLVPPLEWLDIRDEAQMGKLSNVLSRSPFLMEFYLHEDVFPQLLRHTDAKLSASGQDLGGEMICGSRLGFSGTPNDLLPRALGSCVYAQGDDTKMLHTLSDPSIVEISPVMEGWSARGILEVVAAERPPLNALIDVGALITGLTNLEVAQALLDHGLPFEGVVFCDNGGEQQLLRRGRREPVRLAHCTLPPERRFVFYDQVHTTGIDIRHAPGARAALTLGKDTTLRDYAQGAYRMRGIGRGQRLKVLLTPEVMARVRSEVKYRMGEPFSSPASSVASAPDRSPRSRPDKSPSLSPSDAARDDTVELVAGADVQRTGLEISGEAPGALVVKEVQPGSWADKVGLRKGDEVLGVGGVDAVALSPESLKQACQLRPLKLQVAAMPLLDRVCSWLLCQQASAEYTQHHLLRKQAIEHEGRRCSYKVLMDKFSTRSDCLSLPLSPHLPAEMEGAPIDTGPSHQGALDLFRERVDYTIDTALYGFSCSHVGSLDGYLQRVKDLLDDAGNQAVQELVRSTSVTDMDALSADQEQALFAEMEQEHEMELFAEQEQEKEQQEEEEMEEDMEQEPPESSPRSIWQSLKRDDPPKSWPVSMLGDEPNPRGEFYPAQTLHMVAQGGRVDLQVKFPTALWVSRNFSPAYGGRVLRRLRTPAVLLEWVPDETWLDVVDASSHVDPKFIARLRLAMDILGIVRASDLTLEVLHALLLGLGAEIAADEVERVHGKIEKAMDAAGVTQSNGTAPKVSPEHVAEGLRRAHVLEVQPGRYYALLSLAEAEVVRIALHARADREDFLQEKPNCQVALRVLQREPLGLGVLDASQNWRPAPFRWHAKAVAQCLLYLSAESQFHAKDIQALRFLLRGCAPWKESAPPDPDLLRDFWLASYAVRRRPQPALWMEQPVARIFVGEEEHVRMQHEAVLREAYARLLEVGLLPSTAFELLDQDKDGQVSPSDFRASRSVGLGLPDELLLRLFEAVDLDGSRSAISAAAWNAAFDSSGDGQRPGAIPGGLVAGEPPRPPEGFPPEVLRRITIELVPHAAYTSVWTSEGTMARKKLSVWGADQLVSGFLRVTALRLSLGDYANQGFADARGGGAHGVGKRWILQVHDRRWTASSGDNATSEEYLRSVADHYCPRPIKFRHVWSQRRGTPLFVWRPVPPSDAFVALGMVVTTTPEPPPLDRVRCIAKSFCRPTSEAPVLLWEDAGCGGKPASVWLVNKPQALWVASGRSAPQETFWDLAADTILFGQDGKPSVHIHHAPQACSPKASTPTARPTLFGR